MSTKITVKGTDGQNYQFVDDGSPMQGGMKDVYFSPDRSYVVAFFRDKQDFTSKERLDNIVNKYRKGIFESAGGEYWKNLYCWPYALVEYNGRTGVVVPAYQGQFFFKTGYNAAAASIASIKGKEKEGKWFASPQFRHKNFKLHLDSAELGDWFKYFLICIKIARAVKRLHGSGLAHSDLSYRNVLIDPSSGSAAIIDLDGLVVPNKFPPDVIGTPDFIAPEVMSTKSLGKTDPGRKLPSIATDRHALAVMIYMYLLYRHPLRGGKVHDIDPQKDEELSMGSKALFVEHPNDPVNRPKLDQVKPTHLPWADTAKLPYSVCGPYLKALFDKAFIDGLHSPSLRPTADEWEQALIKTVDLLQPCQNPNCEQKWFVFDNTTKPVCPFCRTPYKGKLPVLNFYYKKPDGKFAFENSRLMVYDKQYLYQWHANRFVTANEKLTPEQTKPVGYFVFHQNKWKLVNQRLTTMKDVGENMDIPVDSAVELSEGRQILLSKEDGGRLVIVQLVDNS